jgi:putative oxidoreductase
MNLLKNRIIHRAIRWALAAVFIYAGIKKLAAPQAFADSIATFAILPKSLINLVALSLPPLEIIAGIAIITGPQRRPALLALTVLTVIFIIALSAAIARGIPVDCGCFGSGKPSVSAAWVALSRDIVILAAALVAYLRESSAAAQIIPPSSTSAAQKMAPTLSSVGK